MDVALQPVSRCALPEGARSVYHQLFMSSLLMDLKYKKLFAVRFAKVSRGFLLSFDDKQIGYIRNDYSI